MKDFYKVKSSVGDLIHTSYNHSTEEVVKLIYVLKAWQIISLENLIANESLTFENFYNKKIDLDKLYDIFNKLAKTHKLFQLYFFQHRNFGLHEIKSIMTLVANNELPPITFLLSDDYLTQRRDFAVSHQIAELGLRLLGDAYDELYVPFTNGYSYIEYTDKIIFAESILKDNEFLAEIIRILESKKIIFIATDPLKNPSFTEHNAPHKLRQFENVLSFPPFGIKGKIDVSEDKFHRFNFHKGANLDVAHFEHILSQTKSKAVVLMPIGFTYRGSTEEKFREYLIEKNYVEAIIQLPPNLHSATSIETTFFVINKRKDDDKVLFINLIDESFIKRDGRKLVFKSLDAILDIYENKKEVENISCLVSTEEIANNNYSFAIDRYVIPQEAKELQKILEQFELVNLENIADIRRSQLFKDEGEGKEVYEVSPSDFNKAGYTLECGKIKQIGSQYKRLQTYKLEPYDVLLSTKGTIGKVAIIGEISDAMVASQAIQVIRVQDEDKKEKAIALYMFFKSDLGQTILSSLVAGVAMPQIATAEIKKLAVPVLTKEQQKQTVLNFNSELKMYNEINNIYANIQSIHSNFLEVK